MKRFITLEGPDGSGKTTIARRLVDQLEQDGMVPFYTREPGGSEIAEQIRNIILDCNNTEMDIRTEALLYAAARRQHLVDKVIPALHEGKIVICDRFLDSSLAYQGYAREIGIDEVLNINLFAIDNIMPQLTIFFDITPKVALERIAQNASREVNRLDLEKLEFHNLVYQGYLHVISRYPERFKIVDASKSEDEVFEAVYQIVVDAIKEVA